MTIDEINKHIKKNEGEDKNEISDWYHTFGELYEHRCVLYLQMCRFYKMYCKERIALWQDPQIKIRCSRLHHDGSEFKWRFILWIKTRLYWDLSYHLPEKYWYQAIQFCEVLDKWLERDWHTSADVLERLLKL